MYQLPLFNRHHGTWAEGQNFRISEIALNLLRNYFPSLNPLPRTLHEFSNLILIPKTLMRLYPLPLLV